MSEVINEAHNTNLSGNVPFPRELKEEKVSSTIFFKCNVQQRRVTKDKNPKNHNIKFKLQRFKY